MCWSCHIEDPPQTFAKNKAGSAVSSKISCYAVVQILLAMWCIGLGCVEVHSKHWLTHMQYKVNIYEASCNIMPIKVKIICTHMRRLFSHTVTDAKSLAPCSNNTQTKWRCLSLSLDCYGKMALEAGHNFSNNGCAMLHKFRQIPVFLFPFFNSRPVCQNLPIHKMCCNSVYGKLLQ